MRRAAEQFWPTGDLPALGPVILTITYFYEGVSLDVDNIPKPMMDALKGLVYFDDGQLTDIMSRKRNLNSDFRVESPSRILAEGLSRGTEFLHVRVQEAPDQGVIN